MKVLVEVLKKRSIDKREVNILTIAKRTWMTPLIKYLQHSILPDSHEEASRIRVKAPSYVLVDGELYRTGFMMPWLKCVDETKGRETLQEAHAGQAVSNEGARVLAGKLFRMGIYWVTTHQEKEELKKKCVECQPYSPV